MKAFLYKDELYIKVIPGKNLFKSTMVHEVINRGDIFAVRLSDSALTILDGTIQVEHTDVHPMILPGMDGKELPTLDVTGPIPSGVYKVNNTEQSK
jgi:hypothetical protein